MRGDITGVKLSDIFKTKSERLLEFSPNLYLGDGMEGAKLDKIKRRLRRRPILANVVLIVLSENASDQLEIISSSQLMQEFYAHQLLYVAGIASGKDEAMRIVAEITKDCLAVRKDCSLKEFLKWQ